MMRSFYSTHEHIRLFIFGTSEGWLAAIYDLQQRAWIDKGEWIHGTLREAKADLREKAMALLGTNLPDLNWH
jgi:hypothetical protein